MGDRKIIFNIGKDRTAVIEYEGEFSDGDLYTLYAQCLVDALNQVPPVERLKLCEQTTLQITAAIAVSTVDDGARNPELLEDIVSYLKETLGKE